MPTFFSMDTKLAIRTKNLIIYIPSVLLLKKKMQTHQNPKPAIVV